MVFGMERAGRRMNIRDIYLEPKCRHGPFRQSSCSKYSSYLVYISIYVLRCNPVRSLVQSTLCTKGISVKMPTAYLEQPY